MIRMLFSICIFAAAAYAFTAGFSSADVPVNIDQTYFIWDERIEVPMLTASVEPLSGLRLECCYGFRTHNEKDSWNSTEDIDSETHVFGVSTFYNILSRSNAELSAGLRFLHSSTEIETDVQPLIKSTGDCYGTSLRIDFSIPGIEEIGFCSQWGIDYIHEETVFNFESEDEEEIEQDGWKTSSPAYILSGIYYSF